MSSHSPHASRPSTFRAPGWGAPALLSSCRRWRNTTSRKLVPFDHRSASRIFIRQPGCIPSPVVIQDGDHQFDGGEKQAGLRPLPRPQLQGCSSSVLGRGVRRVGACLRTGCGPLLPSVIGGKGVRRSWRWQLPRVWLSGLSGFDAASGATSHRGSRKRFLCRRDSRCHPRTDLRLYGHGSLSRPSSGDVAEGLVAAASALRSSLLLFGRPERRSLSLLPEWTAASHLGFCRPAGPPMWGGCSYLRGWNRSSVCNGTLSAGVLFIAAVGA
jgi:hypothetical protein